MRLRSLLLPFVLVATPAGFATAQATTGPAVFYAAPGATRLATVARGTALAPGARSGEYVQVTLRGFVARALLGGPRDSFPLTVSATDVRLRGAPSASAPVVAALDQGMGLRLVKRAGSWAEVERTGWVRRSAFPASLAANSGAQAKRTAQRDAPQQPSAAKVPAARPAAPVAAPAAALADLPVEPTAASPAPAALTGPVIIFHGPAKRTGPVDRETTIRSAAIRIRLRTVLSTSVEK